MKTKSTKSMLTALVASFLTACGGGGGNISTGGAYFTHEELAEEFVYRVNVDVAGYDIQLVKANTEQYDYIVVYDWDYGTYDAYYIGNYNPGENLSNYLWNYESYFYYDLTPLGGSLYQDWATGIIFNKSQESIKDLSLKKALQEDVAIMGAAKQLRKSYGLSVEQSLETARFAYNIKHQPKGTYSAKDYDAFAKEMTGSTVTEFLSDIKKGNSDSLNSRIEKAAEVTGLGVEGVNKLVNGLFLGN